MAQRHGSESRACPYRWTQPIPPLDGSSLIVPFLPDKALPTWYKIQQYSMPILMILLIVVPYVAPSIDPISWYMNATAYNLAGLILPS